MVTDFHSHVLPEMDDGSRSPEESVAMLSAMAVQGVSRVVATPHFYLHHEDADSFLRRRQRSYERLLPALQQESGLPELVLGAEVYYFPGISESEVLTQMTIGSSGCVMVEMPIGPWSDAMLRELSEMESRLGLIPIIAHIDRYIGTVSSRHLSAVLEDMPVYVQANALPFLCWSTRRRLLKMLKKGQIQLLGSDCHDTEKRPPNLGAAVDTIVKYLGQDAISEIRDFEKQLL